MSEIPADLKYTNSHEWIRVEENGILQVGITDHAQHLLGDIVFSELPEVGNHYDGGAECAVIESVKAAADVYMPVGGEIIAVNEALADAPETINQSPYQDGWMFKIKADNSADVDALMNADAYQSKTAEES